MADKKKGTKRDTLKERHIPFIVKGYPPPVPPLIKRKDIFDSRGFADIDAKAIQTPDDKLKDFPTLSNHLTAGLSTDVQKVRAIFSWLGHQNVLVTKYPDVTDPYLPKAYLKSIKDDIHNYSKIFAILCREVKIPCVILEGKVRITIDEDQCPNSSWNAVYVEGGWRFIHCQWSFFSVVGRQTGAWLKVEEDGQNVREELRETEGTIIHTDKNKDDYFLVDPEVFIFHCRPTKDRWQLVKSPLTLNRFMMQPFITPSFSETGFSFKNGQEGIVNSRGGQCNVVIKALKWDGQLTYQLFYKQTGAKEFPNKEGAERYVAMLNKNQKTGEFHFRVRFPVEGVYKLSLYQQKGVTLLSICDFKLICVERMARCEPLPDNPEIGWGPSVTAKQEGIYDTSHNEGIIQSRDGKKLEVSFKVKGTAKIIPRLKHTSLPDDQCKQFLTMSIKNNNVSIKVKPDDGEYALLIDTYKNGRGLKNVLNYIIESGQLNRRPEGLRENPTEKMIRSQLKEATEKERKEDLITFIEKFKRMKMDDRGHLTEALQTLEKLEIKENLKYAVMGERTDEIEKAIRRAQTSSISEKVQPDVKRAQAFLNDLLDRKNTPRPLSAVNNRNVAELRTLRTLPASLREIFSAVFMLLGENKLKLQDQGYVQSLLKKTGEEGLIQRLQKFDPGQTQLEVVSEAQTMLEKHQKDHVARISPPALKVYQAGMKCLDTYHRTRSPSIRNDASPAGDVKDIVDYSEQNTELS